MEVDWVTVTAQVVNFAILVWLLQRVLYRPVSRALEARAAAVAARLSEAEAAKAEAEAEAERLRAQQRQLDRQRDAVLDAAKKHAEEARRELGATAQAEIAAEREDWHRQLAAEKAEFLAAGRRRGAESFAAALGRALAEMADSDLIERMAAVFAGRLRTLDETTALRLKSAVTGGAAPLIRVSAPLSAGARQELAEALAVPLAQPAEPVFETDEALPGGLALEVGPIHLRWMLGDYLDDLEVELSDAIDRETGSARIGAA